MSKKDVSERLGVESWQVLMQQCGFSDNQETYENLITAYNEKHRKYHSLKHLEHVLLSFNESKHIAERPHEVELAL